MSEIESFEMDFLKLEDLFKRKKYDAAKGMFYPPLERIELLKQEYWPGCYE